MSVIAKHFGANAAQAKVRTCLGFNGKGQEAAEFYVSLLPGSYLESRFAMQPGSPPLVIEFTLAGTPYMILNDGPKWEPSMAASISVLTQDQAETDRLWAALTADGGQENMCAWLTDKYGISWQIVPEALTKMFAADDRAAAQRAFEAMMTMRKIDIAAVEAAFNGK
jgi:predicted 3-demethylubiquinone-9 3-methyltransferase (glyoxalase superfamily)